MCENQSMYYMICGKICLFVIKKLCIISLSVAAFMFFTGVFSSMSEEKRIAAVSKEVGEAILSSLGEELAGSINVAFSTPKGLRRDGKVWISANQYESVNIKTPLQWRHLERILEALDSVWSETRDESYADVLVSAIIIDESNEYKDVKYLYRSNHGFDRQ
jgi:hypothetical protein